MCLLLAKRIPDYSAGSEQPSLDYSSWSSIEEESTVCCNKLQRRFCNVCDVHEVGIAGSGVAGFAFRVGGEVVIC